LHTVEQKNFVLDRAVSKAGWRLVPALIVMYMPSYLDRYRAVGLHTAQSILDEFERNRSATRTLIGDFLFHDLG
jgi:hypothetical protein